MTLRITILVALVAAAIAVVGQDRRPTPVEGTFSDAFQDLAARFGSLRAAEVRGRRIERAEHASSVAFRYASR
ncbi:MAG TPA: hypothetical protein PKO33_05950 [Pyrinomonadaceae bacterium]|nr:hypothetical protein [Pyrinomonadaceae bacterium]